VENCSLLRVRLHCLMVGVALLALVTTVPLGAKAARIGLNVGSGAGSPGVHLEVGANSRTAFSLSAGLNQLYSGHYIQVGGKFYLRPSDVGPYAHVTGTLGSGRTSHAVWQTGELGVAVGNAWRLSEKFVVNLELGYAVGDGASYATGAYGNALTFAPSGRVTVGWRVLFGK